MLFDIVQANSYRLISRLHTDLSFCGTKTVDFNQIVHCEIKYKQL
jgi:hypothetical protein